VSQLRGLKAVCESAGGVYVGEVCGECTEPRPVQRTRAPSSGPQDSLNSELRWPQQQSPATAGAQRSASAAGAREPRACTALLARCCRGAPSFPERKRRSASPHTSKLASGPRCAALRRVRRSRLRGPGWGVRFRSGRAGAGAARPEARVRVLGAAKVAHVARVQRRARPAPARVRRHPGALHWRRCPACRAAPRAQSRAAALQCNHPTPAKEGRLGGGLAKRACGSEGESSDAGRGVGAHADAHVLLLTGPAAVVAHLTGRRSPVTRGGNAQQRAVGWCASRPTPWAGGCGSRPGQQAAGADRDVRGEARRVRALSVVCAGPAASLPPPDCLPPPAAQLAAAAAATLHHK
jgi:hypothetical protein